MNEPEVSLEFTSRVDGSLPNGARGITVTEIQGQARGGLWILNHDLATAGGVEGLPCEITRQRVTKAIDAGWIALTDNSMVLMPVTQLPDELLHRGRETHLSRSSKWSHNVFGDPKGDAPTYLASERSRCECDAWSHWDPTLRPEDKLLLTIDTAQLIQSRLVYLDPESLSYSSGSGRQGDEVGEMFFVLGGIPWAAIKALIRPWKGSENLVERWPR